MNRTGRPPGARTGRPLSVNARFVTAGVGAHARPLPSRASAADLWASVEALAVAPDGFSRLAVLHDRTIVPPAQRKFSAYVAQARQYYQAIAALDPVSKPLMGYYFALNLTKAYLTAADPTLIIKGHGAGEGTDIGQRYTFTQEVLRLDDKGVAKDLALRTGRRFWYPKGHRMIKVSRLAAYLPEAYDLYADALGQPPKLVPITRMGVRETTGTPRSAWLTVDVDRAVLQQRGINATALPAKAALFGRNFRLVSDTSAESDPATVTYESIDSVSFNQRAQALPGLREAFDASLIARNRAAGGGGQDYVVLSVRTELLSHEAVTFLMLLHLSNMVRYRPDHVEALRGTKYFWLFSSWVDRACENLLLSLASRITLEEHVIS